MIQPFSVKVYFTEIIIVIQLQAIQMKYLPLDHNYSNASP